MKKRSIFILLCCVSALCAAGAFYLLIGDHSTILPSEYLIYNILAIPVFSLLAIIFYIIQSVLKDKEWKQYQIEHPEEAQIIQQQRQAQAQGTISDYNLYQLDILRRKIGSIIGRIIAAAVITGLSGSSPLIWYILVSYCWFFIKLTRNYIIGIAACFLCLFYFADKFSNMAEPWASILTAVLICGSMLIDLVNIIRYIVLKSRIAQAGLTIRKLSREERMSYRNVR